MIIPKEKLTDFKEIYAKAVNLINEDSKDDPPTEPYRSHYAARDLLLQMKNNVHNALDSESEQDNKLVYEVILAFVYRDLGRIYVFTEEVSTGEVYFKECLQLVEPHKLKPEAIIAYICALNESAIVQANRKLYKEALVYLCQSEAAYKEFKATALEALTITDIFGAREEVEQGKGTAELEGSYTLCSFIMAQVYGHLGELQKSAQYCHQTLRRQVEAKSYEAIDFALNAATLSQYFIGEDSYEVARHHLAAATLIMSEHEATMLKPEMTRKQQEDVTETYKHRHADLARCWAKYGLALLGASRERLYKDEEDEAEVKQITAATKRLAINAADYRFPELQLAAYEDRVPAEYCLTFDDAKVVYHFVIMWLDQAKQYYRADTEATEYAKIIQDYAELYQHMAFFEENPHNQAKMQKRRAKYYEDLLEMLNPVFYMAICRNCWYGAGIAYCAVLDVRLDQMKDQTGAPEPQQLQKINSACKKAILNFEELIKSFKDRNGVTNMDKLSADEEHYLLYAHFHLGRLYYKVITHEQAFLLYNLEHSLQNYQQFIKLCDERKEAAKALKAEVGVSKEMVTLLPAKIENVKKRMPK